MDEFTTKRLLGALETIAIVLNNAFPHPTCGPMSFVTCSFCKSPLRLKDAVTCDVCEMEG